MARIIDVVEVANQQQDEMARRLPQYGAGDFRFGSQVIVREFQQAVFFRDGKSYDTFGPGRHTITTMNAPLLSSLVGSVTGGKTPFTAEVYFVSMREFLARAKALLRRATFIRRELESDGDSLHAAQPRSGDLVIDQVRRKVTRNDEELRLKPQEYELLAFLARNRGIALSRELILQQVWGWNRDVGSRTVDVHVRWLRRKIEPNPANPERIVTVRGVGYRFEG